MTTIIHIQDIDERKLSREITLSTYQELAHGKSYKMYVLPKPEIVGNDSVVYVLGWTLYRLRKTPTVQEWCLGCDCDGTDLSCVCAGSRKMYKIGFLSKRMTVILDPC
jgi:hypothetical protein